MEATGFPITQSGSFQSSDAGLDAIVPLSRVLARVSMSDALVDTPGREDGGWIEDARCGNWTRKGPPDVRCPMPLCRCVDGCARACLSGGGTIPIRPRGVLAASWFNTTALRTLLVRFVAQQGSASGVFHPFPPSNYPATASYDWCGPGSCVSDRLLQVVVVGDGCLLSP